MRWREGVCQPLGPWDRDIAYRAEWETGRGNVHRSVQPRYHEFNQRYTVHALNLQRPMVKRAAHSLFPRFKIRNISIIKCTCKNNNKTKHYPQHNTFQFSVHMEHCAAWLGDRCSKGQISMTMAIRALKMKPQSCPERSGTTHPMAPCSFTEQRKTQLYRFERPTHFYTLTSLFVPYLMTLSATEV